MAKIVIEIEDKADGGATIRCNHGTDELLQIETSASGYAMTALAAILEEAKSKEHLQRWQ